MGFSKKTRCCFGIARNGSFAVECVSNGTILKNVFSAIIMSLFGKSQKTLNVGKVRNNDEESMFFRERKRFNLSKSLLHKNGKTQNMPVIAGRIV